MKTKLFLLCALTAAVLTGCKDPVNEPQSYDIWLTSTTGGSAKATIDGAEVTKAVAGALVTLTATEDTDYDFKTWTTTTEGLAFSSATAKTATFVMPERNVSVKAGFEISATKKWNIYIAVSPADIGGSGKAMVNGADVDKAMKDDVVTLVTTAVEGYQFSLWETTTDGVSITYDKAAGTASFTMPAGDVSLTAKYAEVVLPPTEWDITLTKNDGGTVKATNSSSQSITKAIKGTIVTLTATPDEGQIFKGWTMTTAGLVINDAAETRATFTMPDSAVAIAAEFGPEPWYDITLSVGTNGTSAQAKVNGVVAIRAKAGQKVDLTATPAAGYILDRWTTTTADLTIYNETSAASAFFTMPAGPVAITATFKVNPDAVYAIAITAGTGGSAKAVRNNAEIIESVANANVTLIATPDEGYEFAKWTTTNTDVTLDQFSNPTTFTMPSGAVAIGVEFKAVEAISDEVVVNGVTWATKNLQKPKTFAASPTAPGLFYQHDRIYAFEIIGTTRTNYNEDGTVGASSLWSSYYSSSAAWPATSDPCPTGYRVPTKAEIATLNDTANVTAEWIAADGATLAGYKFTDNTSNNSVFFPAAGNCASAAVGEVGTKGYYWSASRVSSSKGDCMIISNGTIDLTTGLSNGRGARVRCVKDAASGGAR